MAAVFDAPEGLLGGLAQAMAETPQDPDWHGEGDVLTHTRLVCRALTQMPAFQAAEEQTRQALYLAAVFHDVGKLRTTRWEDGRLVSPGHARIGAQMTRRILWRDLGLAGTPEKMRLRETVCQLIRYHSLPPHALEEDDGKRRLLRAASNGPLSGFTLRLLCDLAEADGRGRLCRDREDLLERVALCRELAQEAGAYDGPYPFPSRRTAAAYFSGKNVDPAQPLYDGAWGPVLLLAGLPGTGKDTWLKENCPSLRVISLDEYRKALGISPKDRQGRVAEAALAEARTLLREKTPFAWNATDITPQTRGRLTSLFASYGAAVRIVYLETAWEEELRRNAGRTDAVPPAAIEDMLSKLTPPERWEADQVEWTCI